MQKTLVLALCAFLAGCADGGSAADRRRNDHDLAAFGNAGLALTSQVRTDTNNVDEILHRANGTDH